MNKLISRAALATALFAGIHLITKDPITFGERQQYWTDQVQTTGTENIIPNDKYIGLLTWFDERMDNNDWEDFENLRHNTQDMGNYTRYKGIKLDRATAALNSKLAGIQQDRIISNEEIVDYHVEEAFILGDPMTDPKLEELTTHLLEKNNIDATPERVSGLTWRISSIAQFISIQDHAVAVNHE